MKLALSLGATLLVLSSARPDVFVHLFEWTYTDIEKECVEFLGPKGFTAVQISPPTEHAVMYEYGRWYERYQPVSYKLISRSGNEEQLASMIRTCKEAGVGIYVDSVFNHMGKGETGCGVGFAGTPYCNRTYEMWKPQDFHHKPGDVTKNCLIDFAASASNISAGGDPQCQEMWFCDLIGLPDLDTGAEHVQARIAQQLTRVLDLGADGLRVDAAKHMPPQDLHAILEKVQKARKGAAPPAVILELFSNETKPVKPSMYLDIGLVEYFQYQKMISKNVAHIDGGRLDKLRYVDEEFAYPSDNIVTFLDNHDTQRGPWAVLTYIKPQLYVLANIFMLAHPFGYPKVMSSFYLPHNYTGGPGVDRGPPTVPVHDGDKLNCLDGKNWVCEHRITAIANMVAWRKIAGSAPISHWADANGDRIAFARGSAFVALNRNFGFEWVVRLQTGMPAGNYCDLFQSDSEDCPYVIVDADGFANIKVPAVSAVMFHANAKPMMASLSSAPVAWWSPLSWSAYNWSGSPISCLLFAVLVGFAAIAKFGVSCKSLMQGRGRDDDYLHLAC